MWNLVFQLIEPANMVAILAAVAVFATIVTVAMPVLQRDELSARMKTAAIERDKIRARERARLADKKAQGRATLRQDSSRFHA